jgi:hypothetical protein
MIISFSRNCYWMMEECYKFMKLPYPSNRIHGADLDFVMQQLYQKQWLPGKRMDKKGTLEIQMKGHRQKVKHDAMANGRPGMEESDRNPVISSPELSSVRFFLTSVLFLPRKFKTRRATSRVLQLRSTPSQINRFDLGR